MQNELTISSIYESLIEQIKGIDTKNLSDTHVDYADPITTKEIEKQKVYYWIRLYLKDEISDLKIGDDFDITYIRSGETLSGKFIAFGKKNLNRDLDNVIVNYDPEDNPKCLCIMIDEEEMKSEKIPFIRTLFKTSSFFEYQVYRREELTFTNTRTLQTCEYVDCDF
jgi:hypothetical protein